VTYRVSRLKALDEKDLQAPKRAGPRCDHAQGKDGGAGQGINV
jgi:hypothetical protein